MKSEMQILCFYLVGQKYHQLMYSVLFSIFTQHEPETVRKVFLGGLTFDTREEDLREYFCKYGEITDVAVIRDKTHINNKSKGFGFVTFKTAASVNDVIKEGRENATPGTISRHKIRDRYIACKRAIPREVSINLK